MSRRYFSLCATIWALFALVSCSEPPRGPVDFAMLKDDSSGAPALALDHAGLVMRRVREAISNPATEPVPAALRSDTRPRIVFLSASDDQSAARVARGAGHGWNAAVTEAIEGLRRQGVTDSAPTWKLDVVRDVGPRFEVRTNARRKMPFERSLCGVALESGYAALPEEVVARTVINSDGILRPKNIVKHLRATGRSVPESLRAGGTLAVRSFRTESYGMHGDDVFALYRGHRAEADTTPHGLLVSARLGGEYLKRAVGSDGVFVYSYLPKTNTNKTSYNMVRHAGTVYAMLDLWETTHDEALLEAAEAALAHLLRWVQPYGEEADRAACLAYRGKVKLGGVALTAVALAEHCTVTKSDRHLELARRLCRYIELSQLGDGSFTHQRAHPTFDALPFVSEYYPGEAILALTRVHAVDGDERWLDVAARNARYLITVRDKGVPTRKLIHDHWLLYALNDLHRARPNSIYLEHAMRIAEAILGRNRTKPMFPDWLGSYYSPPRSTPSATRTEGLTAAYALARDFGRVEFAESILAGIERTARFQIHNQLRPVRAMYLPDPEWTIGGFTHGLENFEVRIDFVQHNVSALLAYHRILAQGG